MVLISFHMGVIQHDFKMYIRGVVSLTIHLAVGVQRFQLTKPMEGQQPRPVRQDLDQVLGRIRYRQNG